MLVLTLYAAIVTLFFKCQLKKGTKFVFYFGHDMQVILSQQYVPAMNVCLRDVQVFRDVVGIQGHNVCGS